MRKFFLIHIFIVLFVVFIPKSLFSAGLSFGYQTSSLDVSQKFNLTLHIDTENQSLNTFSTNLLYPKDLLKVIEIKDNNSIINFWIEKKDDGNGKIYLSGITPGGFSGNKGDIVTITFEPIKSGSGKIMIDKPEVYLHDGVGTKIQIPSKLFDFSISGKYFNGEWKETVDTESPELFTPEIVSAPEIADGKKVVVFYTTDKASGIDHYVVKESKYKALLFFQNWEEVESPYILKYQSGDSTVVVKAVDKAGNTKTVSVKQPENHNFVIEIIISLGMIAVFWLIFFLFFKLIKRTVVLAEEEIELSKVKDFDDIEKLKDPKDAQEITEIIKEESTDSK